MDHVEDGLPVRRLHGDHPDLAVLADTDVGQAPADEVGPGPDPQPVEAVGELVLPLERLGVPAEVGRRVLRDPARQQAAAEEQADQHRAEQQRQPDQREGEEREHALAGVLRRLGDDHVHRAAHQHQQPTGAPGERDGHQQLRRRLPDALGEQHDQRQQRRDRAVEGDQRREQCRQQAHRDEHPRVSGPGPLQEPLAGPGGHAGGVDALADHEQGGDEDDHRVAEAGDGLLGGDQPGGPQREGGEDRDHADGQPVPHEQGDDHPEDDQRGGRVIHGRGS